MQDMVLEYLELKDFRHGDKRESLSKVRDMYPTLFFDYPFIEITPDKKEWRGCLKEFPGQKQITLEDIHLIFKVEEIAVKIENERIALVSKDKVNIGCQEFTHAQIKQLEPLPIQTFKLNDQVFARVGVFVDGINEFFPTEDIAKIIQAIDKLS